MKKLALASLMLLGVTVHASPVHYDLQPEKSLLYVQLFKDRSAALERLAHDHVIMATGWRGAVELDTDNLQACVLSLEIPTAGLVVDDPNMRRAVGYTQMLTDEQRAQVGASMRDATQLDVANHPNIRVDIRQCDAAEAGKVNAHAEIEVRGVRKALVVAVELTSDAHTLHARGLFTATHADFNFRPYEALGGGLRNGEDFTFGFDVSGAAP